MMKPVVVQHSFGDPGSGGPIRALDRMLASPLSDRYEFVRMHQDGAVGGVDHRMMRRWVSMLREVKPDLVHVRGLGNEGFHGALASRLARVPATLVSIHGTVRDLTAASTARRQVLVRAVEPATLTLATDLVTVCRATAERSFLDSWRRKLRDVVPNGVDLPVATREGRDDIRRDLGIGDDKTVLAVVGRLSLEKGHGVLAQAAGLLPPEVVARSVLLLVGDGPDREVIEAGYRAVPSLEVLSLGRRHDVGELLSASDVFVFPTFHENLSNALLEAMAAGLPAVASAVGGNVEVLQRGGGLLVPPGNPAALADAVERLVSDSPARRALGHDARAVIEQDFTLQHMIDGWDRVYRQILTRTVR